MPCNSTSELACKTVENASRESRSIRDHARDVIYPLMHLLLDGKPVAAEELARHSPLPLDQIEAFLDEWGAERNDAGEITGLGLTIDPTPHEYRVGEKTFYTWCAPDALLFPKVLGHTAYVSSADPITGEKISLTVGPEGVEDVNPSTSVVSWTSQADASDIRGTFCRYGRFFARPQTAEQWQQDHPHIDILEVEEALEAVRLMDSYL